MTQIISSKVGNQEDVKKIFAQFVDEVDLRCPAAIKGFFDNHPGISRNYPGGPVLAYAELMQLVCRRGRVFSIMNKHDAQRLLTGINVVAIQRCVLTNVGEYRDNA